MLLINATISAVLQIGLTGVTLGLLSTYSFTGNDVCYEPYNDVIGDVEHVMSLTSCSVVCAKDDCCSFMYDSGSQRCITSSVYARNITQDGCGWKYMVNQNKCDAPGPHMPYAPNTCDPGYSLNPTHNECVQSCDTYGSTFGKIENHVILHLNLETISYENASSAEKMCFEVCIAITDFVCRTMEIIPEFKYCQFSNETALTQPGSYIDSEGDTLYHRNCA